MPQTSTVNSDAYVQVVNPAGASPVVLVCEHASHHIPESLENLGLSDEGRLSHAAWDPGALAVAQHLSASLDAVLVASGVSRLVYDCNRPPSAADAMPARSEVVDVPGNVGLSAVERAGRAERYYHPFRARLEAVVKERVNPVLVTIHSFTPIYHGQRRRVEIGVLHDGDTRLADAMLSCAPSHLSENVERNAPYGPGDGVTHTLLEHAIPYGHPNVMLEIRNDLIESTAQQEAMAQAIGGWVKDAFAQMNLSGAKV